jgi:GUN4-like
MNGEEFLIETNLGNGASLLSSPVIATVDGQKLKSNVDRIIDLVQQLGQVPRKDGLELEEVDVALKITADGDVVLLGSGAGESAITLRFRQRDRQIQSQQVASQPQVTAIPVAVDVYTKLENLLIASQWQSANRETWDLLCLSLGKNLGTYLTPQDIQQIPCNELRKIDQLWQNYSQGNFGLSVQKQAYENAMA